MKNIWKTLPMLAPVLTAGGVAVGAAVSLSSYTVPAYGTEEFKIAKENGDAPGRIRASEKGKDSGKTVEKEIKKEPSSIVSANRKTSVKTTPASASSSNGSPSASSGPGTIGQGNFSCEDGTYQGSAAGFSGEVKVLVTVKDKTITAIDILNHSDDEAFFGRAKEGVVNRILSEQKLEVDAVSGATYSSNGIINAVRNALSGVSGTGQQQGGITPSAAATSIPAPVEKVEETGVYKNGTYEGRGTGFGGELTVKVKISKGKIKKIQLVKSSDGQEYITKAKALFQTICEKQSTNVDAVSGATYSSSGIIEAVRDALSKAAVSKKTPTSTKKPGTTAAPGAAKKPGDAISPGGESPSGAFPYPDGTYTGTGEGYGGPITVKIEIKEKALKSVSVTSHDGEDNGFFQRAQSLTAAIVKSQSVEVDGVSGATYSSKGILEAVKNALEAARNSGISETPTPTETPIPTGTPSAEETPGSSASVYKDGAYSASAQCLPDVYGDFDPYNLNLTVVLEGGKITAIRNIYGDYGDDEAENDSFVSRAAEGTLSVPGVVSQILAKNSTEGIDAVSHATCSSRGIIDACRQALEKAKN